MDVVRITELQPKTYVEQGDYIAIDNQSDGTKKVQFTNLLDDTLSQENKIAPANVVGDKIATVRDTMEDEIATIRAAVGSPLKASTVAQMTDTNKIYVYVGSESGYINGNWYYWNGSAWVSGGVYNSVAVVTDPTLTLSGVPADAKATGDELTDLKADLTAIEYGYYNLPFRLGQTISSTGVVSNSPTLSLSDYISVNVGDVFEFATPSDAQITINVATFNSSKTFINRTSQTGKRMTIESGTAYIRILFGRSSTTGINITAQDLINDLHVNLYGASDKYTSAIENSNLASHLFDVAKDITGKEVIEMTYGKVVALDTATVNLTPVSSISTPAWCAVVPCEAGDRFLVSGKGGSSAYVVGFVKSNGAKISSHGISTTILRTVYTAPIGSAYMILNNYQEGLYSYKLNGDEIENSFKITLDLSDYLAQQLDLRNDNKWYNDVSTSIMLYVGDATLATVKANALKAATIAVLTTDEAIVGQTASYASGYTGRITISADTSQNLSLPANAKYLYVLKENSSGENCLPTITLNASAQFLYDTTKNTNSLGECYRNVRKKVGQLKDIAWTALSAVPKITSGQTFTGSIKGIPYSSAKEFNKFVGFNVSLRTFMTATHNPYSLLYTEDINGDRSTSGYGLTYHGKNCGAYFGDVCSNLSAYSIGMVIPWITDDFEYLSRIGVLEKKADQTANGIYVGDLIWEPGHINVITDVYRDVNGTPVVIDWAETASNLPKITKYTQTQFNDRIANRDGVIYRPLELYKNVMYYPSEFVAVDGESTPPAYQYNPDICTFAGDYASFRLGEEIWINYNLGDATYNELIVYNKSGNSVGNYDLDTSIHKQSIGTELPYGIYTAVITDGVNTSEPTHFEVIDTYVDVTQSGTVLDVEFTAHDCEAMYATIVYENGTIVATKVLTVDEVTNKAFTFDFAKVHKSQREIVGFTEPIYLKVMFKGQYGSTANTITPIES